MPTRGRKPKPTKLKLLQGTDRPCRTNPDEPEPETAIPDPPPEWAGTNPVALEEWERLTPQLHDLGLLTDIDRAALVGYCEAWSVCRKAQAIVQEEGLVAETTNGNQIQHPAVGIANTARKQMLAFAAEFGMTPSARSRVSAVGGKKKENPFAGLRRGS